MIRATRDFVLCLALTASTVVLQPAWAEESFESAIGAEDLAQIRGGDEVTNSFNTTNTTNASQTTTATNQDNTIAAGGDVVAGNIAVNSGAFNDVHGMTNVVMNTAPQANVQGVMNMNLILH